MCRGPGDADRLVLGTNSRTPRPGRVARPHVPNDCLKAATDYRRRSLHCAIAGFMALRSVLFTLGQLSPVKPFLDPGGYWCPTFIFPSCQLVSQRDCCYVHQLSLRGRPVPVCCHQNLLPTLPKCSAPRLVGVASSRQPIRNHPAGSEESK